MKIKRSRISQRPKTAILLATILFLSACGGGGSGDNRGTDTDPDTSAPEAVTLACEELGYPCSLAEVPDAIMERSLSLAEEALDMIDGDASMADTRAWLEGEPDVVEIHSDDLAMRFRLDGGRGTWVVRPEAFGEVDDSVSASAVGPPTGTTPRIVTGPDTPSKRALVLSPLYWEFEENEASRPYNNDGQQIAAILANTRGYENGVQYLYNASPSDTAVTVQHFQGWQQYQVVHVDSHGYTLCEDGTCHSAILFTTLAAVNADEATAAQKAALTNIGAEAIVAKGKPFGAFIGLNADFFLDEYQGNLDNTLVFFNSCASYPNNSTALADAIRGNTSMFLGWNAPVSLPDSNLASKTFYEWLSLSGVTVGEAYNRLGELQTDSKGSRLINSTRAAGGDLRIRDIVTLLHPDTETRLDPSMEVGILGQLGDGAPDAVPYLVQVDGILPDNADDALVHVSVDGVEAERVPPVSSGVGGFPDSWFLSGEVALTDDLEEAKAVAFEAWVELPDSGESRDKTTATLTGHEGFVGTWVVDNGTLDLEPTGYILDEVSGQIRITFKADGSASVVYDGFGTKVHKDVTLDDVGGVTIVRHEEFIKTANAQGVTTYQIDGDQIEFGHFFESNYLDGTETVRQIRLFNPPGYIPDSDETTTRSYGGIGLFASFKGFSLSPNGGTMELSYAFGPQGPVHLYRTGAAGG